MKSNKKLIYICSIIIILGGSYLFLSGKINFTKKQTNLSSTKTEVANTLPIVSNILVKNINKTGAIITWESNIPVTGKILYSTNALLDQAQDSSTNTSPFLTLLDTRSSVKHTSIVRNLKENTKYYYQIISTDKNKNEAKSDILFFNTTGTTSTVRKSVRSSSPVNSFIKTTNTGPLSLTSVSVKNITSSTANIFWKTNIPASSQVFYGTESSYNGTYPNSSSLDQNKTTIHNISLTGLLANQKIYYQVVSVDTNGVKVSSKESSFKVATVSLSGSPTVIFHSGGSVETVSVSWKTNVPAKAQILYGDTSSSTGSYGHESNLDTSLSLLHSMTLNNLMNNIRFYYRIVNIDSLGTKSISNEYSFITPAANYIVQKDITSNSATITWNTPMGATGKIVFGTVSGTYPFSTSLDNSLITSHTITINSLQRNTKYYYQIVSGGNGIIGTKSDEHSFTTLN